MATPGVSCALKISASEIDIRPAAEQMLRDPSHSHRRGEAVCDTTFEDMQAGERTAHLFPLANLHSALVAGTGDLSELALGYTTYGVGDLMPHYDVNAAVPKALIQHLIRWATRTGQFDAETSELQFVEETIGPYALQGFHPY